MTDVVSNNTSASEAVNKHFYHYNPSLDGVMRMLADQAAIDGDNQSVDPVNHDSQHTGPRLSTFHPGLLAAPQIITIMIHNSKANPVYAHASVLEPYGILDKARPMGDSKFLLPRRIPTPLLYYSVVVTTEHPFPPKFWPNIR